MSIHVRILIYCLCSDGSGPSAPEADVEDCADTYSNWNNGLNDASCTSAYNAAVCEYDIYGTGHAASSSTPAGVVLRGSFIEIGLNTNGSIGIL